MPEADVAAGQRLFCLRQSHQATRDRDLLRGRAITQVALPAQPGLDSAGAGGRVALPAVEAVEPAQRLRLDAIGDAMKGDLVVAHGLCWKRGQVFRGELVEQQIDPLVDLLRGPTPPLPSTRTHVRIVSNMRSVSSKFCWRFLAKTRASLKPPGLAQTPSSQSSLLACTP